MRETARVIGMLEFKSLFKVEAELLIEVKETMRMIGIEILMLGRLEVKDLVRAEEVMPLPRVEAMLLPMVKKTMFTSSQAPSQRRNLTTVGTQPDVKSLQVKNTNRLSWKDERTGVDPDFSTPYLMRPMVM